MEDILRMRFEQGWKILWNQSTPAKTRIHDFWIWNLLLFDIEHIRIIIEILMTCEMLCKGLKLLEMGCRIQLVIFKIIMMSNVWLTCSLEYFMYGSKRNQTFCFSLQWIIRWIRSDLVYRHVLEWNTLTPFKALTYWIVATTIIIIFFSFLSEDLSKVWLANYARAIHHCE